jgi:cytochrome c biogenesis protein CcdA
MNAAAPIKSNLVAVLTKHYRPLDRLGSGEKTALMVDLESYRMKQTIVFVIIFVAVLVIFGIGVYALLQYMTQPGKLRMVIAAMGISITGSIELMRRVAREWGRLDYLIMMLKHADPKDAQKLIAESLLQLKTKK